MSKNKSRGRGGRSAPPGIASPPGTSSLTARSSEAARSGDNISRELGEHRSIARRDFLQGALVASATALTGPLLKAYAGDGTAAVIAAQDKAGYYPPSLTGMRGSHP